MTEELTLISIAVLGGTGKEGSGLALRWANSGYRVLIGSRDADRAATKAEELNEILGDNFIKGMENSDAAARADIVVLSVPYSAHKTTLESVKHLLPGKLLIDVTVPIMQPPVWEVNVPPGTSAALEAQELLGEEVRVVSAFQNVSAPKLKKLHEPIECDVLVCGDDNQAKIDTIRLVEAAGMRGIDAGPLVKAIAAEALTPILVYINKHYGVKGAGVQISGVSDWHIMAYDADHQA